MTEHRQLVRVVTSAQAAARDALAIAAGTPSPVLMQRAGAAAAGEIMRRFSPAPGTRVLVLCGPGNNGGDGWIVAAELARRGLAVDTCEAMAARTPDAIAAREAALRPASARLGQVSLEALGAAHFEIVIDALLGTGATGVPRGAIAEAVAAIESLRARGARVVALDLPTGLDATTGDAQQVVHAHLTVTFGTIKRGQLVSRGACGELVTVDIGLGAHAATGDGAGELVDESWVAEHVPVIHADAHKGTRRKIAIVGGAEGMSGAAILAARSAMRSGAGMVKVFADTASLDAVRCAEPAAMTAPWPVDSAAVARDVASWADAIAIGPGLGQSDRARTMLEGLLRDWRGPVVLDADALNIFAGRLGALAALLDHRAAILTPHAAEFARLAGCPVADVLASRFEIGQRVADRLGAVVLLKGTPTVVFTPGAHAPRVSASGTPALATAGSGDVLTGIAVTLLAQMHDAADAAACAAWVHGRAAELAQFAEARRDARGVVLDDVLHALPEAWRFRAAPPPAPVLVELPAVERAP